MKIGPHSGQPPQFHPRENPPSQSAKSEPPDSSDRIEISLVARKQLAESADNKLRESKRPDASGGLDQAGILQEKTVAEDLKLVLIRQRINSGFYDRLETKLEIARKLAEKL